MLHNLPPNKWVRVLTKVIKRLNTQHCDPEARTITAPSHKWLLPQGDIQRHPYMQPESAVKQRVDKTVEEKRVEQRVAPPLTRITDAPPIITALNPMAPRKLKKMKRMHSRLTRNNIPGGVPPIVNIRNHCCIEVPTTPATPTISPRRSPCHAIQRFQ
jgi:hypothetical protein